jgi:hypothetical protein
MIFQIHLHFSFIIHILPNLSYVIIPKVVILKLSILKLSYLTHKYKYII